MPAATPREAGCAVSWEGARLVGGGGAGCNMEWGRGSGSGGMGRGGGMEREEMRYGDDGARG